MVSKVIQLQRDSSAELNKGGDREVVAKAKVVAEREMWRGLLPPFNE